MWCNVLGRQPGFPSQVDQAGPEDAEGSKFLLVDIFVEII